MIKFSWEKINNKFDWSAFNVLEYFFLKEGVKYPSYLLRKIPEKVKEVAKLPYPSGDCYIIDIGTVLREASSPNELYRYIELASRRNMFDYHMRGVKHLPLALAEEHEISWIEINPMMKIENDNIYFKYEQEKTEWA